MSAPAAIEASGVTVAFGAQTLFTKLSLSVSSNQILGLVGPSGAGKTSLGKLLCGLLAPSSGSVRLNGRALADLAPVETPVMCWQDASLFEHLDVSGNIALGLSIRYVPNARRAEIVERLLDGLGLAPLRHTRPQHLSGGERARVGLARALAVNPDVLILDEPFASLDVISRDRAMGVVREFVKGPGKVAVLISHIFTDIAALCRDVIVMDGPTPKPQIPLKRLIEQPRSAFEAQISGRWRYVGAKIRDRRGSGFVCDTALGEIVVDSAPWILTEGLAIGTTAAIIANLEPGDGHANDLADLQTRWLISE